MSDLASQLALTRTPTHLPLSWYFDPKVAEIEQKLLFDRGPGYVGHAMMAPQPGDYRVLDWREHGAGWMLVNNDGRHDMVSNVCRHRQAVMLKGAGQLPGGTITCPVHRWTYDARGKHIGRAAFPGPPVPRPAEAGPAAVARHALQRAARHRAATWPAWVPRGSSTSRATCSTRSRSWTTTSTGRPSSRSTSRTTTSRPFHPGLGHFVTCDDLKWEYGDWYSVQTVGVNKALSQPGSAVYAQWHEQVLKYRHGEPPPHGAIWLTYYPNIMVEWYPHVLVISTLWPRGPEKCANVVEFYYPEEIALFEREFVEAEQKAYDETAVEDKEICDRMTQGRRALWREGREEHGPYQSPMEDGMVHFHEFMRREIAQHL